MSETDQHDRWRCLVTGCNPVLLDEAVARQHQADNGHRVAKWPIRSAEGKKKARKRNRSGYYGKYNVGSKDRTARAKAGHLPYHDPDRHYDTDDEEGWDAHKN
jgi:hypothetical protein